MKYRVLIGLNYPDSKGKEKRVEPGMLVEDLPLADISWLLEQHCVEPVTATVPPAEEQGG